MSSEKLTRAQEIWNEIKGQSIDMYALPNQTAEKYCVFMPIHDKKCFLKCKGNSVAVAIEDKFGKKYNYEMKGDMFCISDPEQE